MDIVAITPGGILDGRTAIGFALLFTEKWSRVNEHGRIRLNDFLFGREGSEGREFTAAGGELASYAGHAHGKVLLLFLIGLAIYVLDYVFSLDGIWTFCRYDPSDDRLWFCARPGRAIGYW